MTYPQLILTMPSIPQGLAARIHDAWDGLVGVKHQMDLDLPAPAPHVAQAQPSQTEILSYPSEKEFLDTLAPDRVRDMCLALYDPGVMNNELLNLKLFSTLDSEGPGHANEPEGGIVKAPTAARRLPWRSCTRGSSSCA